MDPVPVEGNVCDDSNRPVKPHIVECDNRQVGYVDNSDLMASSYSVSRRNFKWTSKLFLRLLDVTVLNSRILLSSCGAKHTHRDFKPLLGSNLIEKAWRSQDRPSRRLVGRPNTAATNAVLLESCRSQQRPAKSVKIPCRLVHLSKILVHLWLCTVVRTVSSSRNCQFFCPAVLSCIPDRWRPVKAAVVVHTHAICDAVSSVVIEIAVAGKIKTFRVEVSLIRTERKLWHCSRETLRNLIQVKF